MTEQEEMEYLRELVKEQREAMEVAYVWIANHGFSESADKVQRLLEEYGVGDQRHPEIRKKDATK